MKNYECMLILGSHITEEKRGELIKKFSKMASTDTMVEKMGMRKFSVPINYRKEGFYVLMHFRADNAKIAEMTKLMNITDGVERFMFVQKTDGQLEYDAERRAKRAAARAERTEKEYAPREPKEPKTEPVKEKPKGE